MGSEGHVEVVKLLLGDPRVDANAKSHGGTTPLHLATAENHHKVVQLLLDSPRLITVNWADKSSPVRTALVTESKDALEELLNHSKVCLGTSEETWKSLEKVARSTGRPDLLDMVKGALDHRREDRTEEVRDVEEGASAKRADDNEGPGQGQITEEARGVEGEGRSTTTDAVDGAAALGPALVAEKLCWNCGTPGKESNLCTCRGCRKTTKRRQRRKEARQRGGEVNEGGDGVEGQGGLEDFDGLSINEVD